MKCLRVKEFSGTGFCTRTSNSHVIIPETVRIGKLCLLCSVTSNETDALAKCYRVYSNYTDGNPLNYGVTTGKAVIHIGMNGGCHD